MKKKEELAEVISLAEVRHQRRYSFNHPSFYNKLKSSYYPTDRTHAKLKPISIYLLFNI